MVNFRSLEYYMSLLPDSGYVVTHVSEPHPTPEQLKHEWWRKNFVKPLFMLVVGERRQDTPTHFYVSIDVDRSIGTRVAEAHPVRTTGDAVPCWLSQSNSARHTPRRRTYARIIRRREMQGA
jgi:hypothetical protein